MQDEKRFYVYVHRRKTDGRIFYVGKGSGPRAWHIHNRNRWWKNCADKNGFTCEIVARFSNEVCAYSFEEALIRKIGISNLTNISAGGRNSNSGAKWSDEMRLNMSLKCKSGDEHHAFDSAEYTFYGPCGEVYKGTRKSFSEQYGFKRLSVSSLVLGDVQSMYGWRMREEVTNRASLIYTQDVSVMSEDGRVVSGKRKYVSEVTGVRVSRLGEMMNGTVKSSKGWKINAPT